MRTLSNNNNYALLETIFSLWLRIPVILMLVLMLYACSPATEPGQAGEKSAANSSEEEAAIPDSDIYLAPLQFDSGGVKLGAVKNITQNPGYDNQPFFLPDNNIILFTSQRGQAPDNEQSDIYAYYIDSANTVQVTQTPESEYSPTLTPQGERVSTVRVEMDSTQRLWEFSLTEGVMDNTHFKVVFPEVKRVGYHAWTDTDNAMLFLVDVNPEGDQHTLETASRSKDGSQVISTKIGRSLAMRPGHQALSFIDKGDEHNWLIKLYDLETNTVTDMLPTLGGSEDLVWLDANTILMAKEQSIYLTLVTTKMPEWKSIFSGATQSIEGEITRLAVSPDRKWLAFVATQ